MLSVIIITKNEEHNLRRCLESVRWADEIIVVDSGSTDNTLTIAKEFNCKIAIYSDWQGYGIQKERALQLANNPWVLNLDADEALTSPLALSIKNTIKQSNCDAYRIPIKMNFYNQPLRFSYSPSRHIRLFRREGVHYSSDVVHEKIVLPASFKVGKLRDSITHNTFNDMSHALDKLNRYSSYSAGIRLKKNKKTSFSFLITGTCWMFLRSYLLQLGFLDGKAGLIMAAYNAQGTFYRGLKQLYPDSKSAV